jgi:hypothetical protein
MIFQVQPKFCFSPTCPGASGFSFQAHLPPSRAGPCLRPGCTPACGIARTHVSRRGQWPDDPASGAVTWPVAVAPRIGRNAGRWLQSQSESGGRDHGLEGDHGRRAEPDQCHDPLRVSGPSSQVMLLYIIFKF